MRAVGSISDMEEIVKACWSLFQHDGVAVFTLSERSPWPPALSTKYLPGERTQILNIHRIRRIDQHLVERDEDSTPEILSDTKNWLNWSGDLDNPNNSADNCAVLNESQRDKGNGIEDLESPEQRDLSAAPNVPNSSGPHGCCRGRLWGYCWWSIQWKWGGIKKLRISRTQCVTMFHLHIYVAWRRVSIRDTFQANGEQSHVNIGS